MPLSCSRAPAITTTSASRSPRPWSVTIAGSIPPLTASRRIRRAMLATIWMWTRLWSDIPSRSEVTCCMYQRAAISPSALTASSSFSSLRLPRVGTLMPSEPTRSDRSGFSSAIGSVLRKAGTDRGPLPDAGDSAAARPTVGAVSERPRKLDLTGAPGNRATRRARSARRPAGRSPSAAAGAASTTSFAAMRRGCSTGASAASRPAGRRRPMAPAEVRAAARAQRRGGAGADAEPARRSATRSRSSCGCEIAAALAELDTEAIGAVLLTRRRLGLLLGHGHDPVRRRRAPTASA